MRSVVTVQAIKQEIDAYEKHFTGAPLLIGVDGKEEYLALLSLLKDDFGKQIIRMSDLCARDFPPDPAFDITMVSDAAKTKPVIWVGAAQASMLYGQQYAERFFINLLGSDFQGPVVLLCPFCCNILEVIAENFVKLGRNIVLSKCNKRIVPAIYVSVDNAMYEDSYAVRGIKELLRVLEDGKYGEGIHLTTSCKASYLATSMYPVSEELSPYQIICKKDVNIAVNTTESDGTLEQWQKLALSLQGTNGFDALCLERLCSISALQADFGDYLSADQETRFLCYIALKVFYGNGSDYLAYCLQKTHSADAFEKAVYTAILDIAYNDKRFSVWNRQRKRMLSSMDENSAMVKDYCDTATIKGKDILWYLSDSTEEERAALIHALCSYAYTAEDLQQVLSVVSPQLAVYLQQFTFDEFNTKVMESDVYVRSLLTDYFQRYKLQKLMNHQDQDFVEIVEAEAKRRSFTKLQARSAIVKKLDKTDSRTYFFDALGVEFLSFIQAKAEEYGMLFSCSIGHCNLPSITSKNKEFYTSFPEGSVLKEDGLDELKHRGTKYDFQFTTEPLHIFDELAILDRDLKKMGSMLAMDQKCQRIIILSDHGASRLAVTYRSENSKLELEESGKHSGRCCPADQDPEIEFVAYEDGFAVLANYERFKGSRKADVETHGGASLEETVVPVIVLTLKPKEQKIFFVETEVSCSPKNGAAIRMFANPPLKKPHMVVGGENYDGKFDGDQHNVVFTMPGIRRKGYYEAEIYDGDVKITVLTFETKRQTGINQLI